MQTDFSLKTRPAGEIAAANKRAAAPATENQTTVETETIPEATMAKEKEAKEKKVIGHDHHGNPVYEGRKVVGKDDYDRDVFDGQVEIKDAHGKKVFQEPWVGKGPQAGPDNVTGEDLGDDE